MTLENMYEELSECGFGSDLENLNDAIGNLVCYLKDIEDFIKSDKTESEDKKVLTTLKNNIETIENLVYETTKICDEISEVEEEEEDDEDF